MNWTAGILGVVILSISSALASPRSEPGEQQEAKTDLAEKDVLSQLSSAFSVTIDSLKFAWNRLNNHEKIAAERFDLEVPKLLPRGKVIPTGDLLIIVTAERYGTVTDFTLTKDNRQLFQAGGQRIVIPARLLKVGERYGFSMELTKNGKTRRVPGKFKLVTATPRVTAVLSEIDAAGLDKTTRVLARAAAYYDYSYDYNGDLELATLEKTKW